MVLARALLLTLLFCGLAGAPAYDIYASTNHEALEAIVEGWDEAALGESASKRLPGRRDMLRCSGESLAASSGPAQGRRSTTTPPSLAYFASFHIDLPGALRRFRI